MKMCQKWFDRIQMALKCVVAIFSNCLQYFYAQCGERKSKTKSLDNMNELLDAYNQYGKNWAISDSFVI